MINLKENKKTNLNFIKSNMLLLFVLTLIINFILPNATYAEEIIEDAPYIDNEEEIFNGELFPDYDEKLEKGKLTITSQENIKDIKDNIFYYEVSREYGEETITKYYLGQTLVGDFDTDTCYSEFDYEWYFANSALISAFEKAIDDEWILVEFPILVENESEYKIIAKRKKNENYMYINSIETDDNLTNQINLSGDDFTFTPFLYNADLDKYVIADEITIQFDESEGVYLLSDIIKKRNLNHYDSDAFSCIFEITDLCDNKFFADEISLSNLHDISQISIAPITPIVEFFITVEFDTREEIEEEIARTVTFFINNSYTDFSIEAREEVIKFFLETLELEGKSKEELMDVLAMVKEKLWSGTSDGNINSFVMLQYNKGLFVNHPLVSYEAKYRRTNKIGYSTVTVTIDSPIPTLRGEITKEFNAISILNVTNTYITADVIPLIVEFTEEFYNIDNTIRGNHFANREEYVACVVPKLIPLLKLLKDVDEIKYEAELLTPEEKEEHLHGNENVFNYMYNYNIEKFNSYVVIHIDFADNNLELVTPFKSISEDGVVENITEIQNLIQEMIDDNVELDINDALLYNVVLSAQESDLNNSDIENKLNILKRQNKNFYKCLDVKLTNMLYGLIPIKLKLVDDGSLLLKYKLDDLDKNTFNIYHLTEESDPIKLNPYFVTENNCTYALFKAPGDGHFAIFAKEKSSSGGEIRYHKSSNSSRKKDEDKIDEVLPFEDVDINDWYYEGVKTVYKEGIMCGTDENIFSPFEKLTRDMIVTILWRIEGMPYVNYYLQFDDVKNDEWYTEAIRWAASTKLVNGYDDKTFGTGDTITREDLAVIIQRYLIARKEKFAFEDEIDFDINEYIDSNNFSDYAIDAIEWVTNNSIMTGTNEAEFNAKASATRAEVATILMRILKCMKKI